MHKKTTNNKRKGAARRRGPRDQSSSGLSHYDTQDVLVPDEERVALSFHLFAALNNVGVAKVAKRWNPNGAWDPDPVLGSGNTLGLSTWAVLYSYYEVLRYHITMTVNNLEAFPINCYFCNQNQDPGTSGGNMIDAAQQKYGHIHTLDVKGSSKAQFTYKFSASVRKILGSEKAITDALYRGLTGSANPGDVVWFGFAIDARTNLLVNGIDYDLNIRMDTKMYARNEVATFFNRHVDPLMGEKMIIRKYFAELKDWSLVPQDSPTLQRCVIALLEDPEMGQLAEKVYLLIKDAPWSLSAVRERMRSRRDAKALMR